MLVLVFFNKICVSLSGLSGRVIGSVQEATAARTRHAQRHPKGRKPEYEPEHEPEHVSVQHRRRNETSQDRTMKNAGSQAGRSTSFFRISGQWQIWLIDFLIVSHFLHENLPSKNPHLSLFSGFYLFVI